MYFFGLEEKPLIKSILPSWALTKWWLSTIIINILPTRDNLKLVVRSSTILAKKILYLGLMPYICILISSVFENVIFRYVNTQVVLQFIFKSIYSHIFKHILLSSYYMRGTIGMQWARDPKGGKTKEMLICRQLQLL